MRGKFISGCSFPGDETFVLQKAYMYHSPKYYKTNLNGRSSNGLRGLPPLLYYIKCPPPPP